MADVRTFRAASMQQALDRVREELGPDAVILHTRQVPVRRLLPFGKPKAEVEITASLDVNIRASAASARTSSRPVPASSGRGAVAVAERPRSKADRWTAPVPAHRPPLDAEGGVELSLSTSALAQVARRDSVSRPHFEPAPAPSMPSSYAASFGTATLPAPPVVDDRSAVFAAKLDSIQKMLENLGRTTHQKRVADEIPAELFDLYAELIDEEVEDDVARELVFRLKENCTPAQLGDSAIAKGLLTAMVESEIRVCDPIMPVRGKRKVVALVGSTGVGKTTTIAKLAANFRLRDGVKMGLVTVDTYRIAAVEQLRTYAEIIDLPMKVVTSPLEMRRALDELSGLDLVLIDTAGRSPRDELQIQELKSLLAEARVDEVHLVMSMTASLRTLETTAQKFAPAGTTSMILTKLDEAAGLGSLLSVSRSVGLPISYVTTGQDVPDDIEPARASRIARLVLGQEKLFS